MIRCLISQRKEHGLYSSLEDLVFRVSARSFNKKSLESLAKSGALDSLSERNKIIGNSDYILAASRQVQRERETQQNSLFGEKQLNSLTLQLTEIVPASKQEKLSWEKELLGLYVSEHPFLEYSKKIAGFLTPIHEMKLRTSELLFVAGIISSVRKIQTKNGDMMAFASIENLDGLVGLVVFPRLFKKKESLLIEGDCIFVSGKKSQKESDLTILVDRIERLTHENAVSIAQKITRRIDASSFSTTNVKPTSFSSAGVSSALKGTPARQVQKKVFIRFSTTQGDSGLRLKEILRSHPGNFPVQLLIKNQEVLKRVAIPYSVNYSIELKEAIEQQTGMNTVSVDV